MPLTFDEYLAGKRKPVTFDAFMAKKADTGVTPQHMSRIRSMSLADPNEVVPFDGGLQRPREAAHPLQPLFDAMGWIKEKANVRIPGTETEVLGHKFPGETRRRLFEPIPNPENDPIISITNALKGFMGLTPEIPEFLAKDLPEAMAGTLTPEDRLKPEDPTLGRIGKEMGRSTIDVMALAVMRQLHPEEYERFIKTDRGKAIREMEAERLHEPALLPLILSGGLGKAAKLTGKLGKAKPIGIISDIIPKERIPTERVPIVEEVLGIEKVKPKIEVAKREVKPVAAKTPEVVAKEIGATFDGIQESPKRGDFYQFTDNVTKSSVLVKDLSEVPAAIKRVRTEFEKAKPALAPRGKEITRPIKERKITFNQWLEKKGIDSKTIASDVEQADFIGQTAFPQPRTKATAGKQRVLAKKVLRTQELQKQYSTEVPEVEVGRRPLDLTREADQAYLRVQEKRAKLAKPKAPPPKGITEAERGAVLDVVKAIREPAGAKRVPYKEAIKTPDRPEMTNMESYYKSISTQEKLTPDQAVKRGIALRQTPTGKIKPAVREAGTFVPSEFAVYENFKDAKQGVIGGTKDWIRYVQEIDGALSLQKKAKLPRQEGPAEKYILRRTEDIMMIEFDWSAEQSLRIKEITKGLSQKQERLVTEVLEETSRPGAYVDAADFTTNSRIRKITTNTKVVKAAQESRKALEHWFAQQNKLRGLRGQELINYREYYAPHILRKTSLWERAFGGQPKAREVVKGPQLPDYIKPNKPFNPRELAREIGLKNYMREMRIGKILEDYANTASRDIHHTSIIQNNKAFIQQLETMGYRNAAEGVGNFTAESFGGVKARMDRAFDFPVKAQKGMRFWRGSLMRSVFPLNWTWNTTVQTLSSALTVMRTGVTGSTRGLMDWFANPAMRNRIKSSYSYRVKSRRGGRITRQDINTGVTEMVSGKRSAWQASIDGANYLTELVERELTGWSIASGLRHGAKRGLKGRALWDYGSDIGAKTQSMYNLENKPGILRSETVQTAAPFQTFIFEMYNTAKELAGKTGTPPGAMTERIGWVLRFTAAAYAGNEMAHAITGRRPWEVYSFIPFSDQTIKPVVDALRGKPMDIARGRGLPSFVGAGIEFANAVRSYIGTGNIRKLRNWGLKYGTAFMKIPGGTQIARMVDGWIAIANEGMKDSSGRTLFRIKDPWEKARAITMGPWRTKAGIKYWDKRKTNILQDLGIMEKPKKKKKTRSILKKLSVF